MQNTAKLLFENFTNQPSQDFILLAQSGSARRNYIGVSNNKKYIITQNDNIKENEAFIYLSEIFSELGLNTPEILSVNKEKSIYVQSFLGNKTLSDVIASEGLSENVKELITQTLDHLFLLQQKTLNNIDFQKTFEYESYDELPVMHDLYYFKNFLVDVLELPYHKSTLLKEFITIKNLIVNLKPRGLMIRDFQSRNIMVNDHNKVSFIDYQAAMEGPLMYDVISFLYQAKANLPKVYKEQMLDYYVSLFPNPLQQNALKESINPIILMRYLQVLGAYGFRGLIQRKSHFIESLDQGIENLFNLNNTWDTLKNFPELQKIIQLLQTKETKIKIADTIKA